MNHDIKEAPFWLVWSENGNPTKKHYKKDEAMIEAGRLSKKHIEKSFYVAEIQMGYISHAVTTKIHLVEEKEENENL